ncbi:MAG: type IV pilus assembly protein PilM [Chthoniobacteraceae bacterium]|nr:type IV pilus assembly protein PilM [Chthoniobacteraceae bacterium]
MAASNRIFCLSLGSQTVRFAEFNLDSRGGLVLCGYRTSELLADPAMDSTRVAQTGLLLRELSAAVKASGSSVNYSIPSQSVFTRFVKLPSVAEEQVGQIVAFEAQQNVPFPIEEVVWDYQLVTSPDPGKLEVVLVAIKSDLLEELNTAVEDAEFRTEVVDVAPMALYNAFRYNYSDLGGCSLLIDIGARTTNLIFVEAKRVFSCSVPLGGNTITVAIVKDFNEPFAAAEERKKRQGFVSLGGTYAEPQDPEVARVSKLVRNTMTRLHAEITRAISRYRTQQGGSQPERVFLCGGAVAMPYMREFFSEKLALPIEFLNPLRNVAVGKGVDVSEISRDSHLLGELVGLGLRSGSDCPMELNLRPASVVQARETAARVPCLVMAGVCFLAILAGWWAYFAHAASVQNTVCEQMQQKVNDLGGVESKFSAIKDVIKKNQEVVVPLIEAVNNREYWVRLIEDINTRLPDRFIWVTSVEVEAPKNEVASNPKDKAKAPKPPVLVLKGFYVGPDAGNARGVAVVDQFAEALGKSPYLTLQPGKDRPATVPPEDWAASYTIRLDLNPSPLKQSSAK